MVHLEGFDNLSRESNNVLNSNQMSEQDKTTLTNLQNEYNTTLTRYRELIAANYNEAKTYVDRTDPTKNPYLNKVIKFNAAGTIYMFYVTKQGTAKYVPTNEILASTNINAANPMTLNIAWDNKYLTQGENIPTTPPLVVGTPVRQGEQFNNEGTNVFVNQFIPENTTPTYMGCYNTSDKLNYIGGAPLPTALLPNGFFESPMLPNNSYRLYADDTTSVPNWYFIQNSIISNSCTDFNFPIPYPGLHQCAGIKYNGAIATALEFTESSGSFVISFYASGLSKLKVLCYLVSSVSTMVISQDITPTVEWNTYSIPFQLRRSGDYVLMFANTDETGTTTTADRPIGIQGVSISIGTLADKKFSVNDCMTSAMAKGYKYYGVHDMDLVTSKGYCAVSNYANDFTVNGRAVRFSNVNLLWTSNTAEKGGEKCVFKDNRLQVLDRDNNVVYSAPTTANNTPCNLVLKDNNNTVSMSIDTKPATGRPRKIWTATLTSTQTSPFPDVFSTGKYPNSNKLENGAVLLKSEYISSPKGNIILSMDINGDLILFTINESREDCTRNGGKKYSTAVYDLGVKSVPSHFGKLGYVTDNSEIFVYPTNQQQLTNTYTTALNNYDTPESETLNRFRYQDTDSCRNKCNSMPDCGGFSIDTTKQICSIKSHPLSYSNLQYTPDTNLYFRNMIPKNLPSGVSSNVTNINTVQFDRYTTTGNLQGGYSGANGSELTRLQQRLQELSTQINQFTNRFGQGTIDIYNQSNRNQTQSSAYLNDITQNYDRIKTLQTNSNLQHMLKDSDIVATQRNYEYMFWSILATGSVLVAMSIMR